MERPTEVIKFHVSMPKKIFQKLEKKRGLIPRSRFIVEALRDILKLKEGVI